VSYTPIERGSSDWDVPVNAAFTSQDARITTNETSITTLNGTTSTHTSQISTANTNITNLQNLTNTLDFQPVDHGIKAWTQDPAGCGSTGSANSGGVVYLSKVILRVGATVTQAFVTVTSAGTGLTAGQNFVGLYDSTGTRLAVSADLTTDFGSVGTKTVSLGSNVLTAGSYYVAILANGTTPPSFMRGNGASASALNVGLASGAGRFLDFGTGQTSLPASITLTSAATNASARWAALN
jgi:hypothetical protein